MTSPSLKLCLFGPCSIEVDGQPRPLPRLKKSLWLLALLALRQGKDVPREWIAQTLWPDSEPAHAFASLRHALANDLRPALAHAASRLRSPNPATLCLDPEVWVDVHIFDAASAEGSPSALAEAVALYRGPLLEGCLEEWALLERTSREEGFHTALERLAGEAMASRQPAEASSLLRRLIASSPLRESAYATLMQALAASGESAGVKQVYRDLRLLLHQELNAEPDPSTTALYEQLRQEARARAESTVRHLPALPLRDDVRSPARRLPVPLTRLIGRERDIEAVTARFTQGRMVTLTGSGGVGKTRLSIAVAETMATEFASGVWFVELAALSDPAQVASAVAQTLQVREQPGQRIEETLTQALSSRSLLLVMDNCEHLLGACCGLARELLSGCAGLRVLATSRQALGLVGEWVYRVPSLETPPPPEPAGSRPDKEVASHLLEYEAVQLFVERAAAQSTMLKLSTPQVVSVAAICRELEGIPLAIEMAAARARSLSVEEIRARLGDRLVLLRSGDRSVLARHQTLRATLDWSYGLLAREERVLLSRLSVFAGGWTLEAAEAVCCTDEGESSREWGVAKANAEGASLDSIAPQAPPLLPTAYCLLPSDALDLLTSLMDKSLVQAEVQEGRMRYRLLETIRQYGQDRLRERGEEVAIRDRHLRYFMELATLRETTCHDKLPAEWKEYAHRMQIEIDNLHAALQWGLQQAGKWGDKEPVEPSEVEPSEMEGAVLRFATSLCRFWCLIGYSSAGWAYLKDALRREEAMGPNRERAEVLQAAGVLALNQGDHEASRVLLEQSLALVRELGDPQGMNWPLDNLGELAYAQGDYGTARALYEQRLALCRALGDRWYINNSLSALGMVVRDQGDYATARALLEESMAICRELGDKLTLSHAYGDLGHLQLAQGDYQGGRALYEEELSLRREVGNPMFVALGLTEVAHAAWLQQDYAGVKNAVREAIDLSASLEQAGDLTRWLPHCQLQCLELLAGLAQSEGKQERSACLFGAAEGLRERLEIACPWYWHHAQRHLFSALQELSETEEVRNARVAGRAMILEQAIAYALEESG
jgi:non-specific serine/threonine protein kinase